MSAALIERRRGKLVRERRLARLRGEEVPMEYGPREEGRGPLVRVVHQYEIPKTMLGPRLARAPEPVKEAVKEAYKEPITYVAEPKEEPKGIAETIVSGYEGAREEISQFWAGVMGWSEEERLKYKKSEKMRAYDPAAAFVTRAPLVVAGAIAEVEAPMYGLERLISAVITHHEPITPTPPYAPSAAIFQTLVSPVTGGLTAEHLAPWAEYPPEYIMGGLVGGLVVSLVTGKAIGYGVGKAWTGTKWVGGRVRGGIAPVVHVPYGEYGGKVAHFITSRAPSPFPEMGAAIKYTTLETKMLLKNVYWPQLTYAIKTYPKEALRKSIFWEMGAELRQAIPGAVKGSIFYEMAAETYPYLLETKYLLKNLYGPQLMRALKTYPKQALQRSIFWEMGAEARQALPRAFRGSIFADMLRETYPYLKEAKFLAKNIYGPQLVHTIKTHPSKLMRESIFWEIGLDIKRTLPRAAKRSIFWELGTGWYGLAKETKMLLRNVYGPQFVHRLKTYPGKLFRESIFYEIGADVYATMKPKLRYMYYKNVWWPKASEALKGYRTSLLRTSPFYEMEKELTSIPSVLVLKPSVSKAFAYAYEPRAYSKALMGRLRFILHMPAPKTGWIPGTPWTYIAKETGKKVMREAPTYYYPQLTQLFAPTTKLVKPVARAAKVVSSLAGLLVTQVAKQKVIMRKKKVPSLILYQGPSLPNIYEMAKSWAGLKVSAKPYPKEKQKPELAPYPLPIEREQLWPKGAPILSPLVKVFVGQAPAQKLDPLQHLAEFLEVTPAQKQRIRQQQMQLQKHLQQQRQREKRIHSSLLRQRQRRRKQPDWLTGQWFFRRHPIPTPEELIRELQGKSKPKPRRRRKQSQRRVVVKPSRRSSGLIGALQTVSKNFNENITRGIQTRKPKRRRRS